MKKEKKEILKDSKYYYKKADLQYPFYRIAISGVLIAIGFAFGTGLINRDNYKEEIKLQEESGYSQYIQNEKESINSRYEKGEFSEKIYNAHIEELNSVTFEGYLKDNENDYYLAQYQEIQNKNEKNVFISAIIATSTILAIGAGELGRSALLNKKAKKLEQEEYKWNSNPEGIYLGDNALL